MISEDEKQVVAKQIGRWPKGIREVSFKDSKGMPLVVRVSSIIEGKPSPNMYWLTDKKLCKVIDHIEAKGIIKELENNIIPSSPELLSSLKSEHYHYIQKRWDYFCKEYDTDLISTTYCETLKTKGIGGLSKFNRVRCLHMHYAHHLIDHNSIGAWLEDQFQLSQHIG